MNAILLRQTNYNLFIISIGLKLFDIIVDDPEVVADRLIFQPPSVLYKTL